MNLKHIFKTFVDLWTQCSLNQLFLELSAVSPSRTSAYYYATAHLYITSAEEERGMLVKALVKVSGQGHYVFCV